MGGRGANCVEERGGRGRSVEGVGVGVWMGRERSVEGKRSISGISKHVVTAKWR